MPPAFSSRATVVALGFASGLTLGACDFGAVNSILQAGAGCPDMRDVGAIVKFDWAGEFGIDVQAAAKLRAGLTAAIEIDRFAKRLDADLLVACGGLAKDLDQKETWKTGKEACTAALDGIKAFKAKLGTKYTIKITAKPPVCSVEIDAMARCAAECDVDLEPGKVEVQCTGGELIGQCSAECSGTCHLKAAAKCEGVCQGSCSASFSGSCGGQCSGTCDGKSMEGGSCAGTCEGSCSGGGEGSCGGQCEGSCELSAAASCSGQCQGGCSVDFEAPRCTGEVTPPKVSAECKASCDARLNAEVQCSPPQLGIQLDGGLDIAAVKQFTGALRTNLPILLNVAVGLKDEAIQVATDVKVAIDGAQASVKAAIDSAPEVGARLTACITAPFAGAISAAASVKASVSFSVDIKASVSASASGSASAG